MKMLLSYKTAIYKCSENKRKLDVKCTIQRKKIKYVYLFITMVILCPQL